MPVDQYYKKLWTHFALLQLTTSLCFFTTRLELWCSFLITDWELPHPPRTTSYASLKNPAYVSSVKSAHFALLYVTTSLCFFTATLFLRCSDLITNCVLPYPPRTISYASLKIPHTVILHLTGTSSIGEELRS